MELEATHASLSATKDNGIVRLSGGTIERLHMATCLIT